jgi:hypothetical protein
VGRRGTFRWWYEALVALYAAAKAPRPLVRGATQQNAARGAGDAAIARQRFKYHPNRKFRRQEVQSVAGVAALGRPCIGHVRPTNQFRGTSPLPRDRGASANDIAYSVGRIE